MGKFFDVLKKVANVLVIIICFISSGWWLSGFYHLQKLIFILSLGIIVIAICKYGKKIVIAIGKYGKKTVLFIWSILGKVIEFIKSLFQKDLQRMSVQELEDNRRIAEKAGKTERVAAIDAELDEREMYHQIFLKKHPIAPEIKEEE